MDREINRFQIVIDSLKKLDDLNNESNHFYYYYSINAGCYNVELRDYTANTITRLAKATP